MGPQAALSWPFMLSFCLPACLDAVSEFPFPHPALPSSSPQVFGAGGLGGGACESALFHKLAGTLGKSH